MFNKLTNSSTGADASTGPIETPPPARKTTTAKIASLLAGDLTIDGNVTSGGDLQVDGVIHGDVKSPRLTIGETGQIEGNIHADVVEARGRVVGSITAKQVRLLATSHIEGDITHEQLTMETGAHFQGRSLKFQRPAPADVVSITTATQPG